MENDNTYEENDLLQTTTQVKRTVKSFLLSTPTRVQKSENSIPHTEIEKPIPRAEIERPICPSVEEEEAFFLFTQLQIDDKNTSVSTGDTVDTITTSTLENQVTAPPIDDKNTLVSTETAKDTADTITTSTLESQVTAPPTEENDSAKAEKQELPTTAVIQDIVEERLARISEAHRAIRKYTLVSVAIGIIPVPMLDLTLLTGLQLDMLHSLSRRYEVPFYRELATSIVSVLVSDVVLFSTATPFASLIKIIPVLGQVAGAVSMGTLSGATTYATGKVFIQHFESGGTFLDFDPEKAKAHFRAFYREGQQLTAQTVN